MSGYRCYPKRTSYGARWSFYKSFDGYETAHEATINFVKLYITTSVDDDPEWYRSFAMDEYSRLLKEFPEYFI